MGSTEIEGLGTYQYDQDLYGPAEDHGDYAHAFGFGVLAAAVDQVLERNTLSTRSAERLRAALAYSRACLVASGYEG